MATLTARRTPDGKLTVLDLAAPCLGCGLEPEVVSYLVRRYRPAAGGDLVPVRVGYHCTCGAVVCDGSYQGHNPNTR